MTRFDRLLSAKDVTEIQRYPLIVLSDNLWSWISFAIKSHTSGRYSHIMMLYDRERLATQDFSGFRSVSVRKYLTGKHRLKFWYNKNWSERECKTMIREIRSELSEPAGRKKYDFLGIAGQWLGIRWLQNKRKDYCSERVRRPLKKIDSDLRELPDPADPSEYDVFFKKYGEWEVFGIYDPDLGGL